MRVLHCIPSTLVGGAERQLSYLASALPRYGWSVDVALVRDGPYSATLQAAGATLHRVGGTLNHDPRLLIDLIGLVRWVKPDILHTWLPQMDIAAGAAALLTQTPWVLGERTSVADRTADLKSRIRRRLGSMADLIVSNSSCGDRLWQASAPRVDRQVIANAAPLDCIDRAAPVTSAESRLAADDALILFVGRLDRDKNIATVVRAVQHALDRVRARAVFCGDGPRRPEIEGAFASRGLGTAVQVRGTVENPWSWMKRANVLVSLSPAEGQPNVVVEAIACGTPLVLSDIAAHRALVPGDGAWFVDPHDPRATAEAMITALENRGEATRRAERARAALSVHSADGMAAAYDAAYRRIILLRLPAADRVAI